MTELGQHQKGRPTSKAGLFEENRVKTTRQPAQELKTIGRSQSPMKNTNLSLTSRVKGFEMIDCLKEPKPDSKKPPIAISIDRTALQLNKEQRMHTAESENIEPSSKKQSDFMNKQVLQHSGAKTGNTQHKDSRSRVQPDYMDDPGEKHRDLAKYIQSMQKRMLGDSQKHAEKITDLQNKRIKQLGNKKVNLKSSASNFSDLKHMTSSGTNLLAALSPLPENNSVSGEQDHGITLNLEAVHSNSYGGHPLGLVSPNNKKSFQVFGEKTAQKPRVILESLESKSQDEAHYLLKPSNGNTQQQPNSKLSRVMGNTNHQAFQPMTPKYESNLVGLSERGKKSRRSPTLAESFNLATNRRLDLGDNLQPRKQIGFESPVMLAKPRPGLAGVPLAGGLGATPVAGGAPNANVAAVQNCKSPPAKKDALKSMIKKDTEINNMHKIDAFLGRDKALQSGKNDLKEKLKKFRNEFNKMDEPDNQPEEGMEHLELKQVIGIGTYAVVNLAKDKNTGEEVAIKLYDRIKLLDPIKHRNFECEVANLRSLTHQNIIKLLDVIEGKKKIVLVMEYVGSSSLFDILALRPKNKLTEQGRWLPYCRSQASLLPDSSGHTIHSHEAHRTSGYQAAEHHCRRQVGCQGH